MLPRVPLVAPRGGTRRWLACPSVPGAWQLADTSGQVPAHHHPHPKHRPGRRDGKNPCCLQNGANSAIFGTPLCAHSIPLPRGRAQQLIACSLTASPRRQAVICKYLKPNSNCRFAARPRLPPRRAGEGCGEKAEPGWALGEPLLPASPGTHMAGCTHQRRGLISGASPAPAQPWGPSRPPPEHSPRH